MTANNVHALDVDILNRDTREWVSETAEWCLTPESNISEVCITTVSGSGGGGGLGTTTYTAVDPEKHRVDPNNFSDWLLNKYNKEEIWKVSVNT